MGNRLELHNQLINIILNNNVYYQPPENFKMNYPCIIYNQEPGDVKRANNKVYKYTQKYNVTFIFNGSNDGVILNMLESFIHCELDNIFVNDNLYHYVFTLYF